MKLIRFGQKGQERPGLLTGRGIVDLRSRWPQMPDIGEAFFRDGWMEEASRIADAGEALDVRLGPPVARPSKIICLGKNYAEHAREGGMDAPTKPLLFAKTPNAVNGPFDPIQLPESAGKVDWEVELAVVMGREARRVSPEDALSCVAGFTIMNDVSAREAQFGDGQWFRGKSFDTFAPMGPALVTPDEMGDLRAVRLFAEVNDRLMQEGCLKDLIFDIPTLIAYISRDITLIPGDIISTGTPAGVGAFRNPPVFLNPGDVATCRIDGIGFIRNPCVAAG